MKLARRLDINTATPQRSVVALIVGNDNASRMATALAGYVHVKCVHTLGQFADLVKSDSVHTAILEPEDADRRSTRELIALLRQHKPAAPILLYMSLTTATVHEMQASQPDGIVLRGIDDTAGAIRAAVVQAHQRVAAASILAVTQPHTPTALRPCMSFVAAHTAHPIRVADAVRASGMPERTLYERCHHARFPTPERIIAWMRLLHAAWHFDRLRAPRDTVMHELQFPSPSAFTSQLRRYGHIGVRDLRTEGGFTHVLGSWERILPPVTIGAADAVTDSA
jgi:AraC-like DNA-binding protein